MRIIGARKFYGNYGRTFQVDEDGNEVETKVVHEKRKGRGRPRKNESPAGNKMEVTPELYHAFGLL